ncbi:MAG: hypothetical protein AB8B56_05630 [Crocinitomicaceae bacterium]
MKKIILIATLFSLATVNAQDSDRIAPTKSDSKFTFGWIYAPEVSYRILSEGDQSTPNIPLFIDSRNDREGYKFGQTFNAFFGYQFASNLKLEAGIGFTDYGERTKPFDLVSSFGPSSVEIVGTASGSSHIFVTTVPINLQFQMGKGKVRGFIAAGIAPGLLTRYMTRSKIEYPDGDVSTGTYYSPSEQENYSQFILSANISGGIDYRYSEKASLRIAPAFRMTANNVYPDAMIRGHYFNIGIEFGAVYHL